MKYLLPPIARDVAMGGVVTEEQAISRAQYLALVYSQAGMMYDLIPQAPRPSTDLAKPPHKILLMGLSVQSIPHCQQISPSNKMLLLLLLQLIRFSPR